MSDTRTRAVAEIDVNGNAGQQLQKLKQRVDDFKDAIARAYKEGNDKLANKLTKDLKATEREIRTMRNDMVNVEQTLKRLDKATPKELRQTLRKLENDLKNIERGSKAWDEQTRKIRAVRGELDKVNKEMREHDSIIGRLNGSINKWGMSIASAAAAFTGLTMAARQSVQAYADIESEMANVRKFTGMSAEEVEHLNEAFKGMDTRTAREDLNKLAQEAGRLGLQTEEDVLGFVKAADVINVALDDLGEGATLTLSKLTDIFGDKQKLGVEQSLLSVGSVINELSQNCTASAPYLAQFAQRLAGVGKQANMTIPEIMGFAAVLDSQGQAVEMSATALSQLIMKIFKDPAKIAKATGMELTKFNAVLKKDTNEALIMLLEQLNKLGDISVLAPVFQSMGTDGARASAVIAALAGNIETVKWQQQEANRAYEEGTSVTKEFNVQNNTVQAQLDKAKKGFQEMAIELGQKLAPAMKYTITGTSAFMRVLSGLITFLVEHKRLLTTLAVTIGAYTVAVKASTVAQAFNNAVNKEGTILHTMKAALLKADAVLWNILTGKITLATAAQKAWNLAVKSNPVGLLTAAIAGAVTGLVMLAKSFGESTKAATEAARKKREYLQSLREVETGSKKYSEGELSRLRALYEAATNETLARKKRIEAVKQMQSLYPSVFSNFSMEEVMAGNAKTAYDKLTDSIIKNARARAAAEKIMENEKAILELEEEIWKLREENKKSRDVINETDKRRREAAAHDDARRPINQDVMVMDEGIHEMDKTIHENTQAINKNVDAIHENQKKQEELRKANKWLQGVYNVTGAEAQNNPVTTPQISYTAPMSEKERKRLEREAKAAQREKEKQARIAAALEKKEFKDAMDTAKANWDNQQTEALKQYREGKMDYVEYLETLHEAAKEYYELALKIHKQHGTEESDAAAKLYKAQEKELQDHEKNMLQIRLERYADERDSSKISAQMGFYDPDNAEAFHNQRLLDNKLAQIDIEYLRKVLAEKTVGTKEYYDAERALDKAIKQEELRQRKLMEQDLATWSIAYQKLSKQKQMEAELTVVDALVKAEKMKVEEGEKAKAAIRKKYRKQEQDEIDSKTGTTAPGSAMKGLGQSRDDALRELDNNRAGMTEEEYQSRRHQIIKQYHDKVTDLIRSEGNEWATMVVNVYEKWASALENLGGTWEEKLKSITDIAEASFAVMNVGLQMYMEQAAAVRDLEVAKAEKSYERQISMAEGNAYKTKQLEKKKQKEVAKIKNDYNKKAQTIEIAQAIASTAMAAINAYASASKVSWILGPIAAAMATAAGMIQVATIKKQHEAEAAGYSKGGFTPAGAVDEPVGVVHAGEWVASQKLLKNPQARAAIEALDAAQRNNTIGRLSATDVSRSVTAPSILAGAAADGSMQRTMVAMVTVMDRYDETMARLGDRLNEPFVTVNTVTGDLGIKQAQDEYQRLQNNTLPKNKRR